MKIRSKFLNYQTNYLLIGLGEAIKFEAKNPIEAIRNSQKFGNLNPLGKTQNELIIF